MENATTILQLQSNCFKNAKSEMTHDRNAVAIIQNISNSLWKPAIDLICFNTLVKINLVGDCKNDTKCYKNSLCVLWVWFKFFSSPVWATHYYCCEWIPFRDNCLNSEPWNKKYHSLWETLIWVRHWQHMILLIQKLVF